MKPENGREAFELAKGAAFDLVCTEEDEKRLFRFWTRAWNGALDVAASASRLAETTYRKPSSAILALRLEEKP